SRLAWPDVAARRPRLAIVPLGATEQHGPHLPYATDTLIADALAARLAPRPDDAVALPPLPPGRSGEHLGFPRTLDRAAETLPAAVGDGLRSLARHAVTDAFVFSAHGGNVARLRNALPRLRAAVPEVRVLAATELGAVTDRLHAEASAFGVASGAAGHHAG